MLAVLQNLDAGILLWIQENLRDPVLDGAMSFYTKLGDGGMLWIVLSLVLLLFPRTRRAGALSLAAMLAGMVCTNLILKPLVDRDRPWLVVEGLIHLVAEDDPHSFPSGHTCAAFAAASVWWRTLPERWMGWTAVALAALMGFSRLYVGVHFPSDVLVGMCVGLGCGWAVWRGYLRVRDRLPRTLQ